MLIKYLKLHRLFKILFYTIYLIQQIVNKPNKRIHHSIWTQNEAKRIYMKKTMNLYHWTQPGLPTDFVRRIVSNSWDNMSKEEKQIYEKQVRKYKLCVIGTYLLIFYKIC